jgi:hypothetical protein
MSYQRQRLGAQIYRIPYDLFDTERAMSQFEPFNRLCSVLRMSLLNLLIPMLLWLSQTQGRGIKSYENG